MSLTFHLGTHSHNRAMPPGGYRSSKAPPPFNNPLGRTTGMVRPLTNLDPTNNTVYKYGSPRPLRQYRNGIWVTLDPNEDNRQVKSHLRGGNMVSKLMDFPGGYVISQTIPESECVTCPGVPMVSTWQPSVDITNNPIPETTSKELCCNQERSALNRVKSANTVLSKRYYTTSEEYRYNRCQNFEQRQFNYLNSGNPVSKPGGPLAVENTYNANCNPNFVVELAAIQNAESQPIDTFSTPTGCSSVIYKPNNHKFACQGSVMSSTRLLRLTVDTLKKEKGYK